MNTPPETIALDKADLALEGLTNIDRFLNSIPEGKGIDKHTADVVLAHTKMCANSLGLELQIDDDVDLSLEAFKIDAKKAVKQAYEYIRDLVKRLIDWILHKFGKKTKRKYSDNLKNAEKEAEKAKKKAKENINDIRDVNPNVASELEAVLKQAEAASLNGMTASEFAVAEHALLKRYGRYPRTVKSAVFSKSGPIASSYVKEKAKTVKATMSEWPTIELPDKATDHSATISKMFAKAAEEAEKQYNENKEAVKKMKEDLAAARKASADEAAERAEKKRLAAEEKQAAAKARKDAIAEARKKVAEVIEYIYTIDKSAGVIFTPIEYNKWHVVGDKDGFVQLDPAFAKGPLDLDGFYNYIITKANKITSELTARDLENQIANFSKAYDKFTDTWGKSTDLPAIANAIKTLQENTLLLKLPNNTVGIPGLTLEVVPNRLTSKGYYELKHAYHSAVLRDAAIVDYSETVLCKDADLTKASIKKLSDKYRKDIEKLGPMKEKIAKRYKTVSKNVPKAKMVQPPQELEWDQMNTFHDLMQYPAKWALQVIRHHIATITQLHEIDLMINNLTYEITHNAK